MEQQNFHYFGVL